MKMASRMLLEGVRAVLTDRQDICRRLSDLSRSSWVRVTRRAEAKEAHSALTCQQSGGYPGRCGE